MTSGELGDHGDLVHVGREHREEQGVVREATVLETVSNKDNALPGRSVDVETEKSAET